MDFVQRGGRSKTPNPKNFGMNFGSITVHFQGWVSGDWYLFWDQNIKEIMAYIKEPD